MKHKSQKLSLQLLKLNQNVTLLYQRIFELKLCLPGMLPFEEYLQSSLILLIPLRCKLTETDLPILVALELV